MPAFKMNKTEKLMSLEEFDGLPEGARVEVIRGIPCDMAGPSQIHQELLRELLVSIEQYIRKKKGGCKVFPAPFDVKLKEKPLTIVEPDLFVVCNHGKLDGRRCNGAPDWIIEIASPGSFQRDYIEKLNLYHQAGVREYWIVNPEEKTIAAYYLEVEKQKLSVYTFDDTVPVGIYSDFSIDFAEIWTMATRS